MDLTRRSLLRGGAGALGASALAGCLSDVEGDGGGEGSGYAAFFAIWDWTQHVGGEEFDFENPVDVGEMGHGWEPGGDLAREIAGTDAFVYLDTPEFAWAQDVAAQLEADYDDVAVIDGMAGLEGELLPWDGGDQGDHDHGEDEVEPVDHEFDPATVEVAELDVIDRRTGEVTAYLHGDHWHGGVPDVPLDETIPVGAVFEDEEGRVLPLGEDEQFQLDATIAEGAQEIIGIESSGDEVAMAGLEEGRTQVVFELLSDGEVVFDTSTDGLDAEVVEAAPEEAPEFYDPHVWVDPVLVGEMVDTIAEALAEIDPDNAGTYEENAAAYGEELDAIDGEFERIAEEAERDVAVLAGHDSFQYIEERYGFDLHTPVGASPDETPSSGDIGDTIEFVNENGIEVILYDHFESPNLAETIVENSEASEIESVSPAEGTTSEWNDEGWGWIEQMEEINVPAFAKALGAE
ncbi:metal ABC transporter substrate-binding protein [Halalkalicoccus tibetensis]|uniref:Metal ABC transporter substrate-binding protein n=1 Tax=Halalkalicoccus tibetensis TaxID=175632 RepID=A0ABD5V636_9EURY